MKEVEEELTMYVEREKVRDGERERSKAVERREQA